MTAHIDDCQLPQIDIVLQDHQHHETKILSPTQVLSEKTQRSLKATGKSHGNRKEQHKRRRVRRQQPKINNTTDQAIILMDDDVDGSRHGQEVEHIKV